MNGEVLDAHFREDLGQHLGGGGDELNLRHVGAVAQNVDVALGKLAEAALLGLVRSPDAADLQGLEGRRQQGGIGGVIAGQRDGQIIAQTDVRQIRAVFLQLLFQIPAALEDLEDQLLILAALLVGQVFDVLDSGGLDLGEAVFAIGLADHAHDVLSEQDVRRQRVAHALDRCFDKVHGVVPFHIPLTALL